MSIIEIYYDAKCKHCKYLEPTKIGRRKFHKCIFHNDGCGIIRSLKDKACNNFEL